MAAAAAAGQRRRRPPTAAGKTAQVDKLLASSEHLREQLASVQVQLKACQRGGGRLSTELKTLRGQLAACGGAMLQAGIALAQPLPEKSE